MMWNEKNAKTFEYYYNSMKYGTYVAVGLTDDTIAKVEKLIKKLGIENPIDVNDLHVTLIYSEGKGDPNFMPYDDIKYEATANGFALYGEDKDTLVLKLESADLHGRHHQLIQNGLRHTFPKYSPHISLSYDYKGELPDSEETFEDDEPMKFTLTQEHVEAIKNDWS